MKPLSILGSTGSIGRSCLKVIEEFPERYRVVGLAAGNNLSLLTRQIEKFRPQIVSVSNPASVDLLSRELAIHRSKNSLRVVGGKEGLLEVATHPEAQVIVSAIVGTAGLKPTYRAICCGKTIALANKEILVAAGELVMEAARKHHSTILPIDSEHSAIHQCLRSGTNDELRRIILTASGGPFRGWSIKGLRDVTPEMALRHPTWNMGRRVTIDSATLMNKGFEVLEAQWLFGIPVDRISVLIHPQSIVHSMVEFIDGSVIAQLGATDMRYPIQYALSFPQRLETPLASLEFSQLHRLEFEEPDLSKLPCLELAFRAARQQGGLPCALNAADEVAVEEFLKGRIRFTDIHRVVEQVLAPYSRRHLADIEEVLEFDQAVRKETHEIIDRDYVH
ncbi:MAG TPA: 1-deoxy-D-xylulose-5-phosphate reductoisomerase [Terriglobia bacterium]|nr:1-deoxy-D-xylulose-5-phosphate reductoisomerase [Terriglobia bacterium]